MEEAITIFNYLCGSNASLGSYINDLTGREANEIKNLFNLVANVMGTTKVVKQLHYIIQIGDVLYFSYDDLVDRNPGHECMRM